MYYFVCLFLSQGSLLSHSHRNQHKKYVPFLRIEIEFLEGNKLQVLLRFGVLCDKKILGNIIFGVFKMYSRLPQVVRACEEIVVVTKLRKK